MLGLGEPGDGGRGVGRRVLQGAQFGQQPLPEIVGHRLVQRPAQIADGVGGPGVVHGDGHGVAQDAQRPGQPDGRGAQQMPGDRLDTVAAAQHRLRRRPVHGLAARPGPAGQYGVAQQRVRVAGAAALVGAQQTEPRHGGEPALDPRGVGPGRLGEHVDRVPGRPLRRGRGRGAPQRRPVRRVGGRSGAAVGGAGRGLGSSVVRPVVRPVDRVRHPVGGSGELVGVRIGAVLRQLRAGTGTAGQR